MVFVCEPAGTGGRYGQSFRVTCVDCVLDWFWSRPQRRARVRGPGRQDHPYGQSQPIEPQDRRALCRVSVPRPGAAMLETHAVRRCRSMTDYQEIFIRRDGNRIHVRDHSGAEPPIVLMHGFPDNLHLYDRLVPYLAARRTIAFDFLGWGESDKPADYSYSVSNQTAELDAVITQRQLERVVLVAHDASGPPAIDWALDHPERVAGLVLLNTYYCEMPTLRAPEVIWLFSTPVIRTIARPVSMLFDRWLFRHMYRWQVGRFFRDSTIRDKYVPLLYQQFERSPSAVPAFIGLNVDLLPAVRARTKNVPRLNEFQ